MKYRELLQHGIQQLKEAAIPDAEVDAWYLLEHVTGMDKHQYFMEMQQEAPSSQEREYKQVLKLRERHKPLQYITGCQEFMGLNFFVNEHVLIPRQDTETLVECGLAVIKEKDRVLDLCTGSGCILISLLQKKKRAQGVGVDISPEALQVAKRNAKENQVEAQWLESDLFTKVEGTFDVIVSNPPYIKTEVIATLMEEVVEHEPFLALDGKEDGLFFYKKIIADAPEYLKKQGYLLFEIGHDQGQEVKELMEQAGFVQVEVLQDYNKNDRVVMGHL